MWFCIAGHSGAGKSPLAKLFRPPGWDPKRSRDPRPNEDASQLISPDEYKGLRAQQGKAVYTTASAARSCAHRRAIPNRNELEVFKEYSFFKVRGDGQLLENRTGRQEGDLRVEIYAPVLVEMVQNRDRMTRAFAINAEQLVVVILNPDYQSIADMGESPSPFLYAATQAAIAERDRARGKSTDLLKALKRVNSLAEEFAAWRWLITQGDGVNAIELSGWEHFEFRYSMPDVCLASAQKELIRARRSLLTGVKTQQPELVAVFERNVLSEDEIRDLREIV